MRPVVSTSGRRTLASLSRFERAKNKFLDDGRLILAPTARWDSPSLPRTATQSGRRARYSCDGGFTVALRRRSSRPFRNESMMIPRWVDSASCFRHQSSALHWRIAATGDPEAFDPGIGDYLRALLKVCVPGKHLGGCYVVPVHQDEHQGVE